MLFEYLNLIFDIDERNISQEEAEKRGNKIAIAAKRSKAEVTEINIEDKTFSMVYIEKKGEPDAWDEETISFVRILEEISNFTVMYADEDYGENLDVILIYNE